MLHVCLSPFFLTDLLGLAMDEFYFTLISEFVILPSRTVDFGYVHVLSLELFIAIMDDDQNKWNFNGT